MSKQNVTTNVDLSAPEEVPVVGKKFKVIKHVSVPTLTLELGVQTYLMFVIPFEQAALRAGASADDRPPMVARVTVYTDLGESIGEHSLVGGSVLIGILDERYPNHAYVGLTFGITKLSRRPPKEGVRPRTGGKQDYFIYLVDEVGFS